MNNTVDIASKMKISLKPHEFLIDPRNKCLIPLAEYIYSLDFAEEPNYNKIKFLITKNLLDCNIVPNYKYDWNNQLYLKYLDQKPEATEISRESMDIRLQNEI